MGTPNTAPTLPSDSAIGAAMGQARIQLGKDIATASKAVPLPANAIPKASDLSVPDFMKQKGFGGALPVAVATARITNQMKQERTLMVAVTLTMPDDRLMDYAQQAKESGAVLVLRGLPVNTSLPQAEVRIARINHGVNATWNIDPTVFRKFKINHVPAAILVDDFSARKMETSCAPEVSFLRVDGDVSIREALSIMARDKSDLGKLAQARLTGIETSSARGLHD
ncbi:type-F conjugative transfer system pilin assembly protein TrbC [Ferrovum sp.]|uniref:type-F conjugative transfer system pilin assembly protein TrbC n=1 Tax=Ferrovum sp. TaxID=2609467 RepID=UPI002618EB76|nr:type-F conjugative transfer system pilin assembly protein TrbC [Ferrovum sp.]